MAIIAFNNIIACLKLIQNRVYDLKKTISSIKCFRHKRSKVNLFEVLKHPTLWHLLKPNLIRMSTFFICKKRYEHIEESFIDENEMDQFKTNPTVNGTKINILSQAKANDYDDDSSAADDILDSEQRLYGKLPLLSQYQASEKSSHNNSPMISNINSNTNRSDGIPIPGSKSKFNAPTIKAKSNEAVHKTHIIQPNKRLNMANSILKNHLQPIESKHTKPAPPNRGIETAFITNGLNSISQNFEFGDNHEKKSPHASNSTKLKQQMGGYLKTNSQLTARSYDAKDFAYGLSNHDQLANSSDNFGQQHSQILNLTDDISDEISKIIKNYPSIYIRRMDSDRKPLPKIQNYLYENNIKYEIAKHRHETSSTHNKIQMQNTSKIEQKEIKVDEVKAEVADVAEKADSSQFDDASYYKIEHSVPYENILEEEDDEMF